MNQERFKGKSKVGQDGGGAIPLGAKPHIYIFLPQEGFTCQMGPGSMFKRQRELEWLISKYDVAQGMIQ